MHYTRHSRLTPSRIWLLTALLGAILLAGCGHQAPSTAPALPASASAASRPVQGAACTGREAAPGFRLLGEVRWGLDVQFAGVPVGGLSSIDYQAEDGRYTLVSDDRSAYDHARLYRARMRYDASGLHDVQLEEAVYLGAPDGQPYAHQRTPRDGLAVPDPEALRLLPGGHSLVWSSEGDFARGFGPELNEARPDGQWLRHWPLPAHVQLPAAGRDGTGPRNNMTLEGIAISSDQRSLWLAMEGALQQDGPLPRRGAEGAPVRITQYDIATRQPVRQLAYVPDALPADNLSLPLMAVNGVSEILADGPDHLLVLERSYVLGTGFSIRLYRIATADATDTLAQHTLVPGQFRAAHKVLLADFAALGLATVDNIEGMTWGPPLESGERVLLLVSDNNFNPAEVTQFVALVEAPACR